MYADLLFIASLVFFILRFVSNEGKDRAIYDLMSALFMFLAWIFFIFPPQMVTIASYPPVNVITNNGFALTPAYNLTSTQTGEQIPVWSSGFFISLTLVSFYLIIMALFMVRDIVLSREQKPEN